jgi:hypothetical protein
MSNFDSTKNRSKTKALPHKATQKSNAENSAKTDIKSHAIARWSLIQSNLGSAASEWTESEQKKPVKTPEEVQFEKVKNIIENLKDKLNEF